MDAADYLPLSTHLKWQPRTQREAVYDRFKGICHWCGRRTVFQRGPNSDPLCATVDHVIPRYRGGGNAKENLVLACNTCNQRRNKEDHLGLAEGTLLRGPIPVKPKAKKKVMGRVALTADDKALLMARMDLADRRKLEGQIKQLQEKQKATEGQIQALMEQKGTYESELHLARIELKHRDKALVVLQEKCDSITIRSLLWSRIRALFGLKS